MPEREIFYDHVDFEAFKDNPLFEHELVEVALHYLEDQLKEKFPDLGKGIATIQREAITNQLRYLGTLEDIKKQLNQFKQNHGYNLSLPADKELYRHALLRYRSKNIQP